MKGIMLKSLVSVAMLFTIALTPLVSFAEGVLFNKIVFIGDSLSDNGNLYRIDGHIIPDPNHYSNGRFSNGPVWSEQVADYYAAQNVKAQNYAVGGETAVYSDRIFNFTLGSLKLSLPISLAGSVLDYYSHSLLDDRSQTLVVIWIGANDYLYNEYNADDRTNQVIAQIQTQIERFAGWGVKNILLINQPDFSKSPYALESNMGVQLNQASFLHNAKLSALAAQEKMKLQGVNIQLFDVNTIFSALLANPSSFNQKYGTQISNVTNACYAGGYEQQDNSGDLTCARPEQYVFWDHLHPTTSMHSILAKEAIAFINDKFKA